MMKKFLSSLLALTMILSLVIVPANAATGNTISGVSITPSSATLKVGETQTIKVDTTALEMLSANSTLTVNGKEVTITEAPTVTIGNFKSSTSKFVTVAPASTGKSGEATATAVAVGTATISCDVTCNYKTAKADGSVTVTLETTITVAAPEVTYTYSLSDGRVSVAAEPSKDLKSGDTVTFRATATNIAVTKTGSNGSSETVSKDKYELSYEWTGATADKENPSKATATLTTEKPNDKLDVTCKVTAAFKSGSDKITGSVTSKPCTVNFTNPSVAAADKAQADFEAAVKNYTVKGRTYSITGGYYYTTAETNDLDNPAKGGVAAVNPDEKTYTEFKSAYNFKDNKLTVSAKVTIDGQV